MRKVKFGKLGMAIMMLMGIVLLSGCGKKVNLLDYYSVEISGMNGYGKAQIIQDSASIENAIAEAGNFSQDSMDSLLSIGFYMDRIKYRVEPNQNLKNGDSVDLIVEFIKNDKDKVKMVGGTKKIKVEGLPEGTKIDIFKDIEVVFSGVSPKGSVEVVNKSNDEFVRNIHFSAEPSQNVKNGDKITVKANYSESEALNKMYIIESDSKEYTVEKLDEYLNQLSQIDQATKENLKKEADDLIEAYMVREASNLFYRFEEKLYFSNEGMETSFKLADAHLLVAKNYETLGYGDSMNQIVLFYDAKITRKSSGETANGYIALAFSDAIIRDGKVDIVYSEGKVVERKKRKDDVERERLTAFKDKYSIESLPLS